MDKFKQAIIVLSVVAVVLLGYMSISLVNTVNSMNTQKLQMGLIYGFRAGWDAHNEYFADYVDNVPNRVVKRYYDQAKVKFDKLTKRDYNISTLDEPDRKLLNASDNNSNVTGMLIRIPGARNVNWPVNAWSMTSALGLRFLKFANTGGSEGKIHSGLDIGCAIGTDVYAYADGVVRAVIRSAPGKGYGLYVIVGHGNGWYTIYGHLSKVEVKRGQYVNGSDLIAKTGNSGRSYGGHLHFEIRHGKDVINPLKKELSGEEIELEI